jgi:protein involved in polysaccharide export with SLBB domain
MQRKITISGAIYYPGIYTIKSPDDTISDILKRAGGLRPNAYAVGSTFTRQGQMVQVDLENILKKPYSKADVNVQDGDLIFVAKKPTITQVLGEVSSPGFYKFIPGKRINDYINLAGGFSQDAEKQDIWIRYPNGKSKHYSRWWSNPKVLDGSVITVGLKKEEEPFDRTEFSKELASIMADFAQVALVLSIIRQ